MRWIEEVRDNLNRLDQSRRALNKFAWIMFAVLAVLAAVVFLFGSRPLNGYILAGAALFFPLCGFLFRPLLKWINRMWMTLAFVMGWFVSRILLSLIFYLVITPIAWGLRLSRRDPLRRRRIQADSYWIEREPKQAPPARYERQF